MNKPRIIIADTELNYLIPIQQKFAEDYFDKIDLEIITDQSYFDEIFSTPRKVDVLIVSEDFYNLSLKKCNIDTIFVLDEQDEVEQTGDLQVNHIYKYYSSIKEFFNAIIGKSGNAFRMSDHTEQETQVILFYSAPGGVGKTTAAVGMAAALTKNYKRALYINAARLQLFQHMLVNPSPISSSEVYARLKDPEGNIYADIKHIIRKESFSYLPPFQAELMSLGIDYSVYRKIILSAQKSRDFDYIIVDADVTYDEEKAELLNIADKVFILTRQTRASVMATNQFASSINGISSDKYIFVCNDFNKEEDNAIFSPEISPKFTSNVYYIHHFLHYEQMKPDDLAKEHNIQEMLNLIL